MAYVRRHGNQVTIVHGERDPETRRVRQRTLFTFYSRDEARHALSDDGSGVNARLRSLLTYGHPKITFDWGKIANGIQSHLEVLPDSYPYRENRLGVGFRRDLETFARRLFRTDPQFLGPSAEVLREHRYELEVLRDLIDWRLELCDRQVENEWNRDNEYYWRYELQGNEAPPEAEEFVLAYYNEDDLEKAEGGVRLLIGCFEGYADGHNLLGGLAQDRGDLNEAIEQFRRAVEVGRRCLPRRVRREEYWSVQETRPYMRGLRSLASALNEAGREDEALEICDQLERECGDVIEAPAIRGRTLLNAGRWQEAAASASRVVKVCPEDGFVVAFALQELGRGFDALVSFLHAAIHRPRTARMLVDQDDTEPSSNDEVTDHNFGVGLTRELRRYLDPSFPNPFFTKVMETDRVDALLDEVTNVVRRWPRQNRRAFREAFDRMHEMRTIEYARGRAREVAPSVLEDWTSGEVDDGGEDQG